MKESSSSDKATPPTEILKLIRRSGLKLGNSGRMVKLDKQDHNYQTVAENIYLKLITASLCKMLLLNIQELNFKG